MAVEILIGDCQSVMPTLGDKSVHCCVTSPPYYGLRDYGHDGQVGLEATPDAYVAKMVEVFREVRRVLRDDGTLWLNLGDSYAGSWGNAGGHNRGKGAQRDITKGSMITGQAERYGNFVPPGKRGFKEQGIKPKDLIGIPWRIAFALQADGWYLRQDIIWHKPNPMPESVRDRCTRAHEYIFMMSKSPKYYYDYHAVMEPAVSAEIRKFTDGGVDKQRGHSRRHAGFNGRYAEKLAKEGVPGTRNKRSVWTVPTKPFKDAHFATFPPSLIEDCVKAGCPNGGTVLDPFGGAGTTGLVSSRLGRSAILIELNAEYAGMAKRRIERDAGMFAEVKREADTIGSGTDHGSVNTATVR